MMADDIHNLFQASPDALMELIKRSQDPNYKIPGNTEKEKARRALLAYYKLLFDDQPVPPHVKSHLDNNFEIVEDKPKKIH